MIFVPVGAVLTSSAEFAIESYEVKAYNYLLKPADYEKLAHTLDECAEMTDSEPDGLLVKGASGYSKVNLKDIEYAEAQNEKVILHLRSVKTEEVKGRNALISMKQEQAEKELNVFRRSEQAVAILRHDMHHYLTSISAHLDKGEVAEARKYIGELIHTSDGTAVRKYCKNGIVNLILSSFEERITSSRIDLKYDIKLPDKLSISDVDMTAILSNALENAVEAAAKSEKKQVGLDMRMNDSKLLLSIKNTYAGIPVF